jgi:hypothetical protein
MSDSVGLKINIAKTSVMVLNSDEDNEYEFKIRGEQIPIVQECKYLGSLFTTDALCAKEFTARINQGHVRLARLKPVWSKRAISDKLKVRLVQSLVFPAVTYGCESWTLLASQWEKLRAFERICYRRVMGISYREHMTNEQVYARAASGPMLEAFVRKRKLSYFGHIARHDSLEHKIMVGTMPGTLRRGGQRKGWADDIVSWIGQAMCHRCTFPEAVRQAQDRNSYRVMISKVTNLVGQRDRTLSSSTALGKPSLLAFLGAFAAYTII